MFLRQKHTRPSVRKFFFFEKYSTNLVRYIFFCYLCTHKECNVMNKIVCLLLFVAALASCTQSEKSYKIGVSQCSSGRWREKVNSEMLAAQHLYEHDVKVSIADTFDVPMANMITGRSDAEKMISRCEETGNFIIADNNIFPEACTLPES